MVPQPPALDAPVLPFRIPLPTTSSRGQAVPRQVGAAIKQTDAKVASTPHGPNEGLLVREISATSSGGKKRAEQLERLAGQSSKGSSENTKTSIGEWVTEEEVNNAKNCWDRLIQQERIASSRLLTFYTRRVQWKLSFCFTLLFVALGASMMMMSAGFEEAIISYGKVDAFKRFSIGTALKAPALMWIALPGVNFNHKSYVASKDADIFTTAMFPQKCQDDTDDLDDLAMRRGYMDPYIMQLASESHGFKPCGLIALSMFTDIFELYACSNGSSVSPEPDTAACVADPSRRIVLNQANISISSDGAFFDDRFIADPEGRDFMVIKDTHSPLSGEDFQRSWVRAGDMLEHYKVWSRAPASPHVRNLWATVEDGLPAGEYALKIVENSPVWEDMWGVSEKQIMFADKHMFGSKNACLVIGVFCCVAAVVEFGFFFTLLVLPSYVPPVRVSLLSLSGSEEATAASDEQEDPNSSKATAATAA